MQIEKCKLKIVNCVFPRNGNAIFFLHVRRTCRVFFFSFFLVHFSFCIHPAFIALAAEDFGPNLVAGDFQRGSRGAPQGWENAAGQRREPLGGLVQWTAEPDRPENKLIRFTLDKKTAENEGALYYSDYFPIEKGATYRFQCRWRSDRPEVKIFIKCYADDPRSGRRREVYRSQMNLKGPPNVWNAHTENFSPKNPKLPPQWGRVMLYAYFHPGTVEFDDVAVRRKEP